LEFVERKRNVPEVDASANFNRDFACVVGSMVKLEAACSATVPNKLFPQSASVSMWANPKIDGGMRPVAM
jgi:hypothetical protein